MTTTPATIGPYQVLRELGRGSFGVVYQARDAKLGRDVAIKVLNSKALASPKALERFLREASVVAQMHHNNIVPVFQLDEEAGAPFIVSKFIPGQVLGEAIPEDGMAPARAIELVVQLLDGLQYAHEQKVLHRDVKPSNAVLDERGQLYLMDFGLAGWVGRETGRMTQEGSVMGTPAYMAPEQARGDLRQVGPAADQYSAGVVLYELLTGRLPFEGGPIEVLIYNVINSAPPPPSSWRVDLDPDLEAICLKAMAKDPTKRYAGCRDFAQALRDWCAEANQPLLLVPLPPDEPPPPPRRPPKQKTISPTAKETVSKAPGAKTIVAERQVPARRETAPAAAAPSRRGFLVIGGVVLAVPVLGAAGYAVYRLATSPRGAAKDTRPTTAPSPRGPGFKENNEKS